MEREAALRDLLAGCAILDGEGLTSAFGHLSARLDDGTLLVSGNLGPGLVRTAADVIRVDAEGTVVEGDAALRAGELPIHLGLLAAPAGGGRHSVARFHGPAVLAWGTLNRPLPGVLGMGLFCGHEVPVFDTETTVTTAAQGAALAAAAAGAPAVLLRGFGAATAGRTVREAVTRAWLLERNAAAALAASAAGTPQPFGPEAAAPFAAAEGPAAAQLARLWHYLCRRHGVT
ncbi:class II aldolase/adducin family protein [Paraconexibacter antarcticus]|uniref:Class II aldolase/adducin family protein n=1 Tax=Paraconexibacter antarcticus TaxID=2949664 RepID=A0ABY5DPN7_9ACTN|nr:class II aldolase/adducin family protein [Paraconexibacter antarcticus]UTI63626.1 class II aldolase/adducin family protein [Paraconexibacter antarcticus]